MKKSVCILAIVSIGLPSSIMGEVFKELDMDYFGDWKLYTLEDTFDGATSYTAINAGSDTSKVTLNIYCGEGNFHVSLDDKDSGWRDWRRNSDGTIDVIYKIDGDRKISEYWHADERFAFILEEDAVNFVKSIEDRDEIRIRVIEANKKHHDGLFPLDGTDDILDIILPACQKKR